MVFSFDSLACDTTSLCDLEQGGTVSRADIQYHIHSETFHLELSEILNTCTSSDPKAQGTRTLQPSCKVPKVIALMKVCL